MKQNKKLIILVGIVLGIIILVIGIININKKKESPKELETEIVNNGVTLSNISKKENKVIEEYEIEFNRKKKKLTIEFTYKKDEKEIPENRVYGTIENKTFELYASLDSYTMEVDEIKITNSETNETYLTVEKVKEHFNAKNFIIIKGEDKKDYCLIMVNPDIELGDYGEDTILYILDENLKLIEEPLIVRNSYNFVSKVENANPWYEDKWEICENMDQEYCHINIKIENEKIYYLYTNLEDLNISTENYGTIEERIYTINNNELKYETINKYKITEIYNMR